MKKGVKKPGNMSQVIRDYAAANPGLGPTQIARDLEAQGHKAYPALVSQALRGGLNPGKRGRPVGSGKSSIKSLEMETLKITSEFVRASGSVEKAAAALEAYKKLAQMFG